jgi:hypothetical protein
VTTLHVAQLEGQTEESAITLGLGWPPVMGPPTRPLSAGACRTAPLHVVRGKRLCRACGTPDDRGSARPDRSIGVGDGPTAGSQP